MWLLLTMCVVTEDEFESDGDDEENDDDEDENDEDEDERDEDEDEGDGEDDKNDGLVQGKFHSELSLLRKRN